MEKKISQAGEYEATRAEISQVDLLASLPNRSIEALSAQRKTENNFDA